MIYEDFIAKEQGVYGKFNLAMANLGETGMQPDPVVTDRKGGYFINFALNPSIEDQIQAFAERVKSEVPSILVYGKEMLHTTLSDLLVTSGFIPHKSPDYHEVSSKLAQAVYIARERTASFVGCSYADGFVFNGTTGILKGKPARTFLQYAATIVEEAAKLGIELRLPWGAHVTFARASQSVTTYDSSKLKGLCDETKIVDTWGWFTAIRVGSFTADSENGFVATYHDQFPLSCD